MLVCNGIKFCNRIHILWSVYTCYCVIFCLFNQKIDTHGRLESVYNVYNEIVEIKKPLKNRLRAVNR